ncbi:MAG: phosphopyruvate hydratase [Planctomycetes bacterium]|nr:phosphopyruvate hydratase [Planctomycetota bacterium]
MPVIRCLTAREILDSRGRPTVAASCELDGGAVGTVSVPSGASTGTAEAMELRDLDANRFGGFGCRKAAGNVTGPIATAVCGRRFETQAELDAALIAVDGTPNKSRLGANAILAVSLAFARAHAANRGVALYQHFADQLATPLRTLPRLTINLFSGGKHAGGQVCIQDVLLVPTARTIDDGLSAVFAVYQAAVALTRRKYGARALTADEGGLAPPFVSTEAMLADAVEAITAAGLKPGQDMALAVDVASTHFYADGQYHLDGKALNSRGMIGVLTEWCGRYPIVSLEDGLAEDDWDHWPRLRESLGSGVLVVGDDLLCTNPARVRRAATTGAATGLLLKVNQVGTLTEAAEAYRAARAAGWLVTVSARSGETEDDWLADLSVGWGGDQIKVGSVTHSERLAKYNRLLAIEADTGLPVVTWPTRG